jgi:NAD+ synthase
MLSAANSAATGSAALAIDCATETQRIQTFLHQTVSRTLSRRGLVVGVSGGIDSAVCVSLAVRALGPDRVLALLMPEGESSDGSLARAKRLCEKLGIQPVIEDISSTLAAAGCYERRDQAIRQLFPAYGAGWRQKIVISGQGRLPYFTLVVESPSGERQAKRMPLEVYLQVVAATNYKQRVRKMTEYYHADRLNYAVIGTPNRLEYELGFFVRGGDGLADLKPIAHLYKSQVYAIAAHLGVTEEIRRQLPSTDTYSLPQDQEEFYFALPYQQADVLLHAMNSGQSPDEAAARLGLQTEMVEHVYKDFTGKRRLADRLLLDALTLHEGA